MTDDLEYLEGFEPNQPLGRCWSCQVTVNTGNSIWLSEKPAPVCKACWEQIPPGQRLLIAQKFASSETMETAARLLAQALKRALDEDAADGFLRQIGLN